MSGRKKPASDAVLVAAVRMVFGIDTKKPRVLPASWSEKPFTTRRTRTRKKHHRRGWPAIST